MFYRSTLLGVLTVALLSATAWSQVSPRTSQPTNRPADTSEATYNQTLSKAYSTLNASRNRSPISANHAAISRTSATAARPVPTQQPRVYSSRNSQVISQEARLRMTIPLQLEGVPAKTAIEYVGQLAGLNLMVNWKTFDLAGIDTATPIKLQFSAIPVSKALEAICMQMTEDDLYLDVDQWVVRILTKDQAHREVTVTIYPVDDLLYSQPNFDNAPEFDLSAIATDDVGGTSIFSDTSVDREEIKTRLEKGEELCDLVRNTIEPEIWQVNGGLTASIRYFNGMLIVRAPKYVHERIGFSPTPTGNRAAVPASPSPVSRYNRTSDSYTGNPRYRNYYPETRVTGGAK